MNIVRVTATSDVLRTLHDIHGFEMVGGGLTRAPGEPADVWITSAYATDEAIAQARARGARVEVVLDADTRLAQLNREAEQARARLREIATEAGRDTEAGADTEAEAEAEGDAEDEAGA